MTRLVKVLLLLSALCGAAAEAQEGLLHSGKTGICAGVALRLYSQLPYVYAEDVLAGMIIHVVPAVALRPSVVFYKRGEENTDNVSPTSSTSASDGGLGVGLGAFYYTRPKGNLSLYVGPEAKYLFSAEIDSFDNGDKKSELYTQRFTASALFGTQYMLSDRFGFQADVGLGVIRDSQRYKEWSALGGSPTKDTENLVTSFFIRPAYLGAVFYFN
jgi:hypothetical protein